MKEASPMKSRIVSFLVAALGAGIVAASAPASARYLVTSGYGCPYVSVMYWPGYRCGVATGTAFNPTTTSEVEIDFYQSGQTGTYAQALACRQSWTGGTYACGNAAGVSSSGAGDYHLYPEVSQWKAGTIWDYRYTWLITDSASSVYGTYIVNTDP
jgi:hypothetical protein